MFELERVVPTKKIDDVQITAAECDQLKQQYVIDDKRGEISLFNSIWFQFYMHSTVDSFDGPNGNKWNRYNGDADLQGVYPIRQDSKLLRRDGFFITSKYGLPFLGDQEPIVELAADNHRANEHRALKAMHLMACRLHNARMRVHGNFELARAEVTATCNLVTMNETRVITGLSFSDILNKVQVPNMHRALEFYFGFSRYAHSQMPDTVNDRPIFEPGPSAGVDLIALHQVEKSRALNLGVSKSMANMMHLKAPHSILDRTLARHIELGLPSHQDWCNQIGIRNDTLIDMSPYGCPLWPAALIESEKEQREGLGRVYGRSFADGIAGSMMYGNPGKGLWFARNDWKNAPMTTLEVIEYSLSEADYAVDPERELDTVQG